MIDDLIKQRCPYLTTIFKVDELLEKNDDQYALLRNVGFGASDSSKLLGINPYTTLNELLKEKRSLVPVKDEIKYKATVRKGRELEDLIMKKISKILEIEIYKPAIMYGYKDTRLTVNFDGVTPIDSYLIPVEIKLCTTYGRKYYDFRRAITEDIKNPNFKVTLGELKLMGTRSPDMCGYPINYYSQLQQQILFLDAPFGILGVLDDQNWTLELFLTYRDNEMIKDIQVAEVKHRWNLHSLNEIKSKIEELA